MPAAANRGRSAGSTSWRCSIRGMNGSRPAVGSSASSAARTAASPIAWIWVAMPPAAARSTRSRSASGSVIQIPRRRSGRERVVGLRLDVGEEGCRPRAERAVRVALLPADPGTSIGVGTEDVAAAQPTRERRREGVIPDRGVDPDGQAARLGQAGIGREREPELRVGRDVAGIVHGDDAERQELMRDRQDPALEVLGRHQRDVDRHHGGRPPRTGRRPAPPPRRGR